jgi:hypothetical protein
VEWVPTETVFIDVNLTADQLEAAKKAWEEKATAYRPAARPMASVQPGSANEIAAQRIVQSEARRDSQGRLAVYNLPARDGGGRYEVAGINERYHPQKAAELAALIRAGRHEEAERQARDYIIKYTDGSAKHFDDAGVQYLVRDIAFNRGPGGANAAIRMAIGERPASKTMAHRNLTADELARAQAMVASEPQKFVSALTRARSDYEYRFVGKRDEFDAGLRNRWASGQRTALSLLGAGRTNADARATDAPADGEVREANTIPGAQVSDAGGGVEASGGGGAEGVDAGGCVLNTGGVYPQGADADGGVAVAGAVAAKGIVTEGRVAETRVNRERI